MSKRSKTDIAKEFNAAEAAKAIHVPIKDDRVTVADEPAAEVVAETAAEPVASDAPAGPFYAFEHVFAQPSGNRVRRVTVDPSPVVPDGLTLVGTTRLHPFPTEAERDAALC